MPRQKKIKSLQIEETNLEATSMTEVQTLPDDKDEYSREIIEKELEILRAELEKAKQEIAQKKQEIASSPRRELSNQEVKILEKQIYTNNEKQSLKEKIERQKSHDKQMITGKFLNRRAPGQSVKLTYIKYEDDPVKWWFFEDGKTYTIPKGFADQINGGDEKDPCYFTPKFVQKQGEQVLSDIVGENSAIAEVDTSNKKYAFVPVNF